jgi:hypothetical protein
MVASELSPDYRASIAEAVEAIGAFTTATEELRECYSGRPNPGLACPALTELQHQMDYAGAPDDQPIDNLMSIIELIVQAGNDGLRAVGTLVETEPIFVWAHLPTGRSGGVRVRSMAGRVPDRRRHPREARTAHAAR